MAMCGGAEISELPLCWSRSMKYWLLFLEVMVLKFNSGFGYCLDGFGILGMLLGRVVG